MLHRGTRDALELRKVRLRKLRISTQRWFLGVGLVASVFTVGFNALVGHVDAGERSDYRRHVAYDRMLDAVAQGQVPDSAEAEKFVNDLRYAEQTIAGYSSNGFLPGSIEAAHINTELYRDLADQIGEVWCGHYAGSSGDQCETLESTQLKPSFLAEYRAARLGQRSVADTPQAPSGRSSIPMGASVVFLYALTTIVFIGLQQRNAGGHPERWISNQQLFDAERTRFNTTASLDKAILAFVSPVSLGWTVRAALAARVKTDRELARVLRSAQAMANDSSLPAHVRNQASQIVTRALAAGDKAEAKVEALSATLKQREELEALRRDALAELP